MNLDLFHRRPWDPGDDSFAVVLIPSKCKLRIFRMICNKPISFQASLTTRHYTSLCTSRKIWRSRPKESPHWLLIILSNALIIRPSLLHQSARAFFQTMSQRYHEYLAFCGHVTLLFFTYPSTLTPTFSFAVLRWVRGLEWTWLFFRLIMPRVTRLKLLNPFNICSKNRRHLLLIPQFFSIPLFLPNILSLIVKRDIDG